MATVTRKEILWRGWPECYIPIDAQQQQQQQQQ